MLNVKEETKSAFSQDEINGIFQTYIDKNMLSESDELMDMVDLVDDQTKKNFVKAALTTGVMFVMENLIAKRKLDMVQEVQEKTGWNKEEAYKKLRDDGLV